MQPRQRSLNDMQILKYIERANKYNALSPADFSARVHINLLTNFTDATLQKILLGVCLEANIFPWIYAVPYKQYGFALNDRENDLYLKQADITFIFFDINHYITSAFTEDTAHFADVINRLNDFCASQKGPIVLCTFILPYMGPFGNLFEQSKFYIQIQEYNAQLKKIAEKQKNIFVFEINRLVHFFGERNIRDNRGLYAFDMPFTNDFLAFLANEWLAYIYALVGKTKKCIVVDLDNTLWGGIVGEVGALGIALGPDYPGVAFQNFQRALLSCYERGLVLAINSRNNIADVDEVFEKNQHMILKKEHFAAIKINWEDKAKNLIDIANELNIGIDSLVFFDDDPVNRELVKSRLPDVVVPHFTLSPEEYIDKIFTLNIFNQFKLTAEDMQKGEMYAAELQRKNVLATTANLGEYLSRLEIQIEIKCNNNLPVERIAQLTIKTNQFNLTTRRYTEIDIDQFMRKGVVYGGVVKDKFGDYGLTIAAIILIENTVARIDSFLMSCRVMGREVEVAFLDYVLKELYNKGVRVVEALYIPTAKNNPVKNFYNNFGFEIKSIDENEVAYILDLQKYAENNNKNNAFIKVLTNNSIYE